MIRTAILVDGGFYRKRAKYLWGKKTPEKRCAELYAYCGEHLKHETRPLYERQLYRIFYYDCGPLGKTVYHPLLHKGIDYRKSETYAWTNQFFEELKKKRKVALRLGTLSDTYAMHGIRADALRSLCDKEKTIDDLTEADFEPHFSQKGVDMKIGIDIASLALKKQVDQIILIAGDSDFVPAAKLARREGVDFILDPMGQNIKDDLFEHIDGLNSMWTKSKRHR